MERVQFIFWELTKVVVMIFLGLVCVKAVGALKSRHGSTGPKWLGPMKSVLYVLILALVATGARIAGYDFAAEFYYWVSSANLKQSQLDKAYSNAERAIALRPGVLIYWQELAEVKLVAHQYASLAQDEEKIKQLAGGALPEDDGMRMAACDLALGHYHQTAAMTSRLIALYPHYAVPYLFQGRSYIALKDYSKAAETFLRVLQFFPTSTPAVDGLAQAYYLAGDPSRCLAVLNATQKYHFSSGERRHFEELKELYGQ